MLFPLPGIDEASLSIGDSSSGHERSPLEALPFTDGEIAGQGAEKRPRPTERPHSGLYPYGGEPQPPDSRETAHTFTEKILTDGDCYTPSETAAAATKEALWRLFPSRMGR